MSVNCQEHFYNIRCYKCRLVRSLFGVKLYQDCDVIKLLIITSYAYFTLTRQEYLYPDAADRQRLMLFHKKARKHRWDVEKYNRIKQVKS